MDFVIKALQEKIRNLERQHKEISDAKIRATQIMQSFQQGELEIKENKK